MNTSKQTRLTQNLSKVYQVFSEREKQFIVDNIFSFECFFSTNPILAIRAFLFPDTPVQTKEQKEWNILIKRMEQKFLHTPNRYKDSVLENIYYDFLMITEKEPSQSARQLFQVKKLTHQIQNM